MDLQVSLLAEHEITRLIKLVTAIAEKLDVKEASNPEIEELSKDVCPEKVLEMMDKHERQITDKSGIISN